MVADVKLWKRLLEHSWDELSPQTARAVLKLDFAERDRRRVKLLVQLSRDDALNAQQRDELDVYLHVGRVITMMHSRARQLLRNGRKATPRRKVS